MIKDKGINKTLRLKIVEHFGTQEKLSFMSGIDEAVISKIVRNVRIPTKKQKEVFSSLLKTSERILFKNI